MKALSVRSPWAELIHDGKKTIETRTWSTKYRGALLLCCSKKPLSVLSGKAFACAELVECRRMVEEDVEAARCAVYPRAFSWILANVRSVNPFPIKGQLGLFEVELPDGVVL